MGRGRRTRQRATGARGPGLGAPPSAIAAAAEAVQQTLLAHFPDRPRFERQCKRAAMLLDQLLRPTGIRLRLHAGWIGPDRSRDTGHVWVTSGGAILDLTLAQFADRLDRPVPAIVWGPARTVEVAYGYVRDGRGPWTYRRADLDPDLLAEARARFVAPFDPTRATLVRERRPADPPPADQRTAD